VYLFWRVIGEGIGLVEGEDNERPSWAVLRIQNIVLINKATEHIACLSHTYFSRNDLAMLRFVVIVNVFAYFYKLVKKVILTRTGKGKKFTSSASTVTSL
jgi:hypothetical protein